MNNKTHPPESYESGKAELDRIRKRIENNEFDMDELEQLIDRGKFLIEYLTDKLKNIDRKLEDNFNK